MIELEGPGWRLARDSSRDNFPVLIGGEGWALELTEQEWQALILLVNDLLNEYKKLESQLMPDESISLELERESWWGCLDGDKNSWSLQFVFQQSHNQIRGFEACWPDPASKAITAAMRNMWDCCH